MPELQLDKEIMNKFDISIKSITPYRDTHILLTSKGRKLLKKSSLPSERIAFVHAAKEYLVSNNFNTLDRYLCTTDNLPFFEYENNYYTISDSIEGKECNFDDCKDISNASQLLASLHKSTIGFKKPENSIPRDELGKLPIYFEKRLEDIKRLRNIAKKEGSKFDYLYLEYFDYFYTLAQTGLGLLKASNYSQLIDSARSTGVLCHHDFTYHNIICTENKTFVINFDYCCFEISVYDLANFLRRKMRKCKWSFDEAKLILDKYLSVNSLTKDELEVLKIILIFPQKFWRVANKYYNSKRSWSEKSYLSKLQEVIEEIEHHNKFMEKFEDILK